MKFLCTVCLLIFSLSPLSLLADTFPNPANVRVEGTQLVWDAVPDAGGYNIYWERGYLTTVTGRSDFDLQLEGYYQVVAFDETVSLFSNQFADGVDATYEEGEVQSTPTSDFPSVVSVVSNTCQNVNGGDSCVASCRALSGHLATGGACVTSDVVEADAFASQFSYACSVPTFSGEVTSQVYCIDVRQIRNR